MAYDAKKLSKFAGDGTSEDETSPNLLTILILIMLLNFVVMILAQCMPDLRCQI